MRKTHSCSWRSSSRQRSWRNFSVGVMSGVLFCFTCKSERLHRHSLHLSSFARFCWSINPWNLPPSWTRSWEVSSSRSVTCKTGVPSSSWNFCSLSPIVHPFLEVGARGVRFSSSEKTECERQVVRWWNYLSFFFCFFLVSHCFDSRHSILITFFPARFIR